MDFASTTISPAFTSDRTPVVIDLGRHSVKVGFAGEGIPRSVLPTPPSLKTLLDYFIFNCSQSHMENCINSNTMYSNKDWLQLKSLSQAHREEWFIHRLTPFFQWMFSIVLQTNLKDRKVILIENVDTTNYVKYIVAVILFNCSVHSLTFISSGICAAALTGANSCLMIDIGERSTRICSVINGRLLLSSSVVIGVGGSTVTETVKDLLHSELSLEHLQLLTETSADPNINISLNNAEDIKVRCCFVHSPIAWPASFSKYDSVLACHEMVKAHKKSSLLNGKAITYPLSGLVFVSIPLTIRCIPTEALFCGTIDDEWSLLIDSGCLSSVEPFNNYSNNGMLLKGILQCLYRCPIDDRVLLLRSLVICGATSLMPGFVSRLLHHLSDTISLSTKLCTKDIGVAKWKVGTNPLCGLWTGASIVATVISNTNQYGTSSSTPTSVASPVTSLTPEPKKSEGIHVLEASEFINSPRKHCMVDWNILC